MTSVVVPAPAGATRPPSPWRGRLEGLAFAGPALAAVLVFFFLPLGLTGWMSLNDWPLLGEHRFNGGDNYRLAVTDTQFGRSLLFTAGYAVLVTAVSFLVGLGLALLVRSRIPGVGLFRTAFFLPVVTGLAAVALLWSWLYNEQAGFFSQALQAAGLADGPVQFLGSTAGVLGSVVVMMVWKSAGFVMLVLLVGLNAVDPEVYEAARVDGAGRLATLWFVTLPLIRRSIVLALVLLTTSACLAFEPFFITARGGPDNSTVTAVHWLYVEGFTRFHLGYAAALALTLLAVILVINSAQFALLRRRQS